MYDVIGDILARRGYQSLYGVLIFMTLRPAGLLFGFMAFTWALSQMRTLRISTALGLALPTLVLTGTQIESILDNAGIAELAFLSGKELLIGYGLGLLASLPFFALQYAGAVTDAFRGESDSGITDPTGGTLQTFSLLYVVIGFAVFFGAGGLWGLIAMLYQSYAIWPVNQPLPALAGDAPSQIMMMLGDMFLLTVRTAIPLLALLVVIEFMLGVAARLSRKFGMQDLTFLAKNFSAILMLPVIALYVLWVADPSTAAVDETLEMLRMLFVRDSPDE